MCRCGLNRRQEAFFFTSRLRPRSLTLNGTRSQNRSRDSTRVRFACPSEPSWGWCPQLSAGDRTVLGRLGRRANKYLHIARDRDRAGSLHKADRPCAVDVARRDAAWRHGYADASATCDVAWGSLAKTAGRYKAWSHHLTHSLCSQVSQATMMSAPGVKPKSFRRMGPIYN